MSIEKIGRSSGKEGPNANNVPGNREERLTDLYSRLGDDPEKALQFIRGCENVEWGPKTLPRDAFKRMHVYTLLFGPYDRADLHTPVALKKHVCEVFGLNAFEDCLTEARKKFLSRTESKEVILARIARDAQRLAELEASKV